MLMWMGQPCPQLDDARKGRTHNSSVVQGALVWWYSVLRSVAVGQLRPVVFELIGTRERTLLEAFAAEACETGVATLDP